MVKSRVIHTKTEKRKSPGSSRPRQSLKAKKSESIRKFTIQQTDKPTVEIHVKGNNYHAYTAPTAMNEGRVAEGKYMITLGVQYRDDEESGSEDEFENKEYNNLKGQDATVKNIIKHIPKKDIDIIKNEAPEFIPPWILKAAATANNPASKSNSANAPHIYKRRFFVLSVAPNKSGLSEYLAKEPKGKPEPRKFAPQLCTQLRRTGRAAFQPIAQNNCVRAWLETERVPGKPIESQPKKLYFISGLLTGLQADSVCYGLSGGAHVRIMEDYFMNNTRGYLIGSLYDAASNKVPKHCGLMNKLVGLNKIPASLLESLSVDLSNYASLSAMTIIETGFTFYEKFGYMAGVLTSMISKVRTRPGFKGIEDTDITLNHLTYIDTYSEWLDQVYNRLCLLYTPITKLQAMIKAASVPNSTTKEIFSLKPESLKKAISACEKGYRLRMSIDTKKSDVSIGKMSLYEVYQSCKILTDLRSEASVSQVVNGKHNPGTNLFYILAAHHIVIEALSGILMHDLDEFHQAYTGNIRECVKFTRVWDTPANNFALRMHRQLPGVKSEYLAERFDLSDPATTPVKKSTKQELELCRLQESVRAKQDRLLHALKTRQVTDN